ncbi:RNA polymerase sigma factor YlaC [Baekduia alba]|nr:RNA polymerase sigma factor YlaC [Baekduia alba]
MRSGIVRLRSGSCPSLFVRARNDPSTFGDVYLAYHDQVLRYLVRQTLDPEVAFDLMAETFAEMLAGIEGFRGATEDEGRQWMWTIARHQLYRWRDRGRVERRHLERIGAEVPRLAPEEFDRIEDLADLERFRPILERALATLSEDQREVLRLRVVEHRPYDEIGELLGASAGAIRIRVSRALRDLARTLDTVAASESLLT